MDPVVIVNFKCYERGTGERATHLARACEEYGAWVCPQTPDLQRVSQTGATALAQHVDPVAYGKHTGKVLPEAVKAAGASGALINHSEDQVSDETIREAIARCKEAGLTTVVCAESVAEGARFAAWKPDYIAVEIPELIGGDTSVVEAEPGIVERAVERIGNNVLLGAGVRSGADVKRAVDEGAAGVILASAVAKKADDPRKALAELYSKLT